jgi:hypothetical protein
MPTWVMGLRRPLSLKKTRSPRLRPDLDLTLCPYWNCRTGESGIHLKRLRTILVKQEQSSVLYAQQEAGGERR